MQVIIVKLISFSKLLTSSEFIFWSFSNQESEKKSLTSVRQAASKTKLLIEKRERKYFIGSLTTFSCVIQHSVAKQMLWSKNHQLFLFPVGTVWEHKPLLPLKKTQKNSKDFCFVHCYYENDCFEFMLRALSALIKASWKNLNFS